MTREFKGTPGPWFFEADSTNNICIVDVNENEVCSVTANNDEDLLSDLEWDNSRIIAKAPELLEMISDMVNNYKVHGYITNQELEDAEELINKALGND